MLQASNSENNKVDQFKHPVGQNVSANRCILSSFTFYTSQPFWNWVVCVYQHVYILQHLCQSSNVLILFQTWNMFAQYHAGLTVHPSAAQQ